MCRTPSKSLPVTLKQAMQALIANNIKAPISPIFMLIDKVRVTE